MVLPARAMVPVTENCKVSPALDAATASRSVHVVAQEPVPLSASELTVMVEAAEAAPVQRRRLAASAPAPRTARDEFIRGTFRIREPPRVSRGTPAALIAKLQDYRGATHRREPKMRDVRGVAPAAPPG